jgi:hypothetical protein
MHTHTHTHLHTHTHTHTHTIRWLWRADHAAGGPVTYDSNPCKNGLIVDGDDVTTYGLAVEHTEQDLTVWNGTISSMFVDLSSLCFRTVRW